MNKLIEIENAFSELKKDQGLDKLNNLSNQITSQFKKTIKCKLVDGSNLPISGFVMSTTPDTTTLDKVLDYAADSSSKIETIVSIWQGSNKWSLEINQKVLELLTARELTALTCHEIWHVIYSDRAVRRIRDGLSFVINTSKITRNMILTSDKFRRLVRIPGLVSCQLIFNKNNMAMATKQHKQYLDKELKADSFAVDNGYKDALISAIKKLEAEIKKSRSIQDDRVARVLVNLSEREDALAKMGLKKIRNATSSEILIEAVDDVCIDWFGETLSDDESRSADTVTNTYMESGIFAKRLQPIQKNQIDYAQAKALSMHNETDRLMLLSYVNSKLELAEWYLAIIDNPKLVRKYKLPHTKQDLLKIQAQLEDIREKILNTKIVYSGTDVIVYYPQGYEG